MNLPADIQAILDKSLTVRVAVELFDKAECCEVRLHRLGTLLEACRELAQLHADHQEADARRAGEAVMAEHRRWLPAHGGARR